MRLQKLPAMVAVLLILASVSASVAEDLPSAPSPNATSAVKPTTSTVKTIGKLAPSERSFVVFSAFSIGATVADMALTNRCVSAGTCVETNPLFGTRPTAAGLYGVSMSLTAGELLLSYYLKKHYPDSKAWMVGPVVSIIAHGAGIAVNAAH